MRKFGLIGFPLGHSFSKQYFAKKFINESIPDCSYENYELEKLLLLKDLVSKDHELFGLNVTIPYKTEVFKYLDYYDNEAAEVGAVNVLKISDNAGRRIMKGFNTDIFGFTESLSPHLIGRDITSAIVLGTGGSSKAVSYVLKKLGINIINVSRKRGEKNILYKELSDEMLIENKLIINTTPLGMFPDITDKPDLDYNCLNTSHILYDLIYNPTLTTFLKNGKERGCKIIGGLEMLHLQAEKSWEIWNDPDI